MIFPSSSFGPYPYQQFFKRQKCASCTQPDVIENSTYKLPRYGSLAEQHNEQNQQ
jgi:hypothetical protein